MGLVDSLHPLCWALQTFLQFLSRFAIASYVECTAIFSPPVLLWRGVRSYGKSLSQDSWLLEVTTFEGQFDELARGVD
jgi:hypothetical protein